MVGAWNTIRRITLLRKQTGTSDGRREAKVEVAQPIHSLVLESTGWRASTDELMMVFRKHFFVVVLLLIIAVGFMVPGGIVGLSRMALNRTVTPLRVSPLRPAML
jgi:hypothetical protein